MQQNNTMPKTAVIMPAYNSGATIEASVRSILNQTVSNLVLIVVNDGSTDDSLEKLIETFQLVKIKWVIRQQLETQPVKAVYQSKLYKNLLVVDRSEEHTSELQSH